MGVVLEQGASTWVNCIFLALIRAPVAGCGKDLNRFSSIDKFLANSFLFISFDLSIQTLAIGNVTLKYLKIQELPTKPCLVSPPRRIVNSTMPNKSKKKVSILFLEWHKLQDPSKVDYWHLSFALCWPFHSDSFLPLRYAFHQWNRSHETDSSLQRRCRGSRHATIRSTNGAVSTQWRASSFTRRQQISGQRVSFHIFAPKWGANSQNGLCGKRFSTIITPCAIRTHHCGSWAFVRVWVFLVAGKRIAGMFRNPRSTRCTITKRLTTTVQKSIRGATTQNISILIRLQLSVWPPWDLLQQRQHLNPAVVADRRSSKSCCRCRLRRWPRRRVIPWRWVLVRVWC